jgi:hypothetical protein
MILALICLAQAPLFSALLKDGTRVECEETSVGETSLHGPWGTRLELSNPVVRVQFLAAERKVLQLLYEDDFGSFVDQAARLGFISALLQASQYQAKTPLEREAVDKALAVLEILGRQWNPLPPNVKAKDRLDRLWKSVQKSNLGMAALTTGRLVDEIPGPNAHPRFRISLSDLRRGYRSKSTGARWAAAAIGSLQQEADFITSLASLSLEDSSYPVQNRAGLALFEMDPKEAEDRWARALWRSGRVANRLAAARHLAQFKTPNAIDLLALPLAASARRSPGRYIFFGHQVSIVTGFDVELARGAAIGNPKVSVLSGGSALHIRVVSASLAAGLVQALKQLTGQYPGPSIQDWLQWYESQ